MDRLVNTPLQLGLINIPALTLVSYPSSAIDTAPEDSLAKLQSSYTNACVRTHISIPFVTLQLQDFPFLFESRLNPIEVPQARWIALKQIDRHDAVICHLLRNQRKEISQIQKLGRNSGLSYQALIDSFCAIDGEARDMRRLRQDFLNLVEYLFGDASVAQAETVLSERSSN